MQIEQSLPNDTTWFPSTDPTLISAPPVCVSCVGAM
jgi:hypothetical protein